MSSKNPILNNPYNKPKYHYHTNDAGELDYEQVIDGRRIFIPNAETSAIPTSQKGQKTAFEVNDFAEEYGTHLINLIRKEIDQWRNEGYPNVTRVSKELLDFWFENENRHAISKLFFAQREAVETAVWLNEAAERSNSGQNILQKLRRAQQAVGDKPHEQLPRIAFKMATGTGKTVVMAALIVYHYFNRREYQRDTRFADYFLVVSPGITIKDRLGVLFVDKGSDQKNDRKDYYAVRDLVPDQLEPYLGGLNSKLVITNYHSFEPRNVKGNKKSPMDGKIIGYNENGKAIKQHEKEDYNLVAKRVLGNFKKGRRLLILNDEAHHCYLPKSKGKTKDTEGDENAKAAIWFTGISELSKQFKLTSVYDLSATPYYLQGSGYKPYSLFGWVVSDFGLIEAIESGLVKIPFMPETDDTHDLTSAKLKNLYEHVKQELPKKGQKRKKADAKKAGRTFTEEKPQLPRLVKIAFDQFYEHYSEYFNNIRSKGEASTDLFTRPPVFIAVCNNTSVSKEVYKFIAGYEYEDEKGERYVERGEFGLFSNYDEYDRLKPKSPTLLIDSEALEESDQIDKEFKKVFSGEIAEFKKEYARQYGQGTADRITDGDILREVVNTVGEEGKLGEHIRCVVSVSMLTEGWDANTVTHIAGLRAFGSQLLCEQVAGRALRRRDYFLQGYNKNGEPETDKRKIVDYKFPPEYAHIIGVPFNLFKGGQTQIAEPSQTDRIYALSDKHSLEIDFPNIIGYRVEIPNDTIEYDFSELEPYEIDGSQDPMETSMETAFSERREKLQVDSVLNKRDQELIYLLTKELLFFQFSDDDKRPKHQFFNQLKHIVAEWYYNRLKVLNREDDPYRKLIYYENPKKVTDHIFRAINTYANTEEFIRPIFNHYNRWGSTSYVNGQTSKDTYDAHKSHVNKVVMDSDWEGVCAKTLEELDQVESYVKNDFLGFTVPYVKDGKDKQYYPDFLVRLKSAEGITANLIIEVTGMNKDKVEKKYFTEKRWLPAVNSVRDKYGYDQWHFIEIANDIRQIRTQLKEKISEVLQNTENKKVEKV